MVDIAKLAKMGSLRKYSAGEYIFREGECGKEMYIILSGKVDVLKGNQATGEKRIISLGAGDFFGEMSLFEGLPRSASVFTLGEVAVIVITENNFEDVILSDPSIAKRLIASLCARIRHLDVKLVEKNALPLCDSEEQTSLENQTEFSEAKTETEIIEKDWTAEAPFLPEGFRQHLQGEPEVFAQFLYEKKVACPICGIEYQQKMVRESKMLIERTDSDLRKHYQDFEPLWYQVWVCPKCYYANFSTDFPFDPDIDKEVTKQFLAVQSGKEKAAFSDVRTLDQVFAAHYLLVQQITNCSKHKRSDKLAKAWLRLSWLHRDAEEEDLAKSAEQKALENYLEFFNQETGRPMKIDQEQQMMILLGELLFRSERYKEAQQYFTRAVRHRDGIKKYNEEAYNRVQDMKKYL